MIAAEPAVDGNFREEIIGWKLPETRFARLVARASGLLPILLLEQNGLLDMRHDKE